MEVNIVKSGPCERTLKVTVSVEKVNSEFTQVYRGLQQQTSFPGFRRGKVPVPVIKKRLSNTATRKVLENLLTAGYKLALEKSEFQPIGNPQLLTDSRPQEGTNLSFDLRVEVLPEINLGKYKGLRVEQKVSRPTEGDIEKELELLRQRHAWLVDTITGAVRENDFLTIDYEVFSAPHREPVPGAGQENKKLKGLSGKDKIITIDKNSFFGLAGQLIGMKLNELKEIPFTFPDNISEEGLRGQKVLFKVKVKQIKEKKIPEINDEFARELNQPTIDQLKEKIRAQLQEGLEAESKQQLQTTLLKEIIKNSPFPVPESLVKQELDWLVKRQQEYLINQGQQPERIGLTEEVLRQRLREKAEFQVKVEMVVRQIAKEENIEVSEEEINSYIQTSLAKVQREDLKKDLGEYYTRSRNSLKENLLREKTLDFLIKNSRIKHK